MRANVSCHTDGRDGWPQQSEISDAGESAPAREDESPLAVAKRVQRLFAGRKFSDSAELIREDRER